MKRILVVDDEEGIRSFVGEVLRGEGFEVVLAADGQEAAERLDREAFHLMVTDLRMPRLDGMALLRKARAEMPEMEVIVLTAFGTVDTAVEAMKLGALDYLTKPLSGPDELRLVAARALERRRLRDDSARAPAADAGELVARDPAMLAVVDMIAKVAVTETPVLLSGESGTGKEVAARALHRLSPRREGPFVAVNCAALAAGLLESEMFGHERGAFTGATETHRGRFELADGGTLLLDEVAEIEPPLQAKLLRAIETRSIERVGSTRSIRVDVRLVAATNRDLGVELQSGRFRVDLYHRLAVFPLRLPPLRERPADILPLARHLLARIGRQLNRPRLQLGEEAERALLTYSWPGNVRELANALERAAILAGEGRMTAAHLMLGPAGTPAGGVPLEGTMADIEREAIRRALAATGGHRKKAAERLGIGLRTLYDKLKQHGL